jgi:hypothetical protein
VLTRDDAFVNGVKAVSSMTAARIIGVYAPVASGSGGLYKTLLERIEAFLADEETCGAVWFDRTSTAGEAATRRYHSFARHHTRRELEDPVPRDSSHGHLIQIADVVAYRLFANVRYLVDGRGRPEIAKVTALLESLFVSAGDGR